MAIDIDEYLKEIDPDEPCGEDLEYDAKFMQLERDIQGKPEQQVGDTVVEAEPPNWKDIKKQADALLARTTDLRVAVCLTRALLTLEGFSGLADGLSLIKAMVEQRWEGFHPRLDPDDDNDPTIRVNVLMSLCDNDTMLWPLQRTPLLLSRSLGQFNLREINIAAGKSPPTSKEKEINQSTIDGAVQDAELETLQHHLDVLNNSLSYLDDIENTVTDYVGVSEAPSFADLRNLLKESKNFLTNCIDKKGGGASIEETATEEYTEENGVVVVQQVAKSALGVINNDQDVVKTLNQVCDYYRKHQPSSPVPFFVERAIRVVGKSFLEVLQDIAPTGLDEAKTILGQKDDESQSSEYDNY